MGRHEPHFAPRLLDSHEAAHYLGISPSKLRTLPLPRKLADGKRLYERADLDEYADSLPYEGLGGGECDEIFGRASD